MKINERMTISPYEHELIDKYFEELLTQEKQFEFDHFHKSSFAFREEVLLQKGLSLH